MVFFPYSMDIPPRERAVPLAQNTKRTCLYPSRVKAAPLAQAMSGIDYVFHQAALPSVASRARSRTMSAPTSRAIAP